MTQGDLFKTKFVRGKKGSGQLFDEEFETQNEPVTCLGMTFENDAARRAYFTEELRKKLKDPEFRKIEGFPLGSDEAILNLSDPPYYTACPNPWISDFIAEWEGQKPEKPEDYQYHREPFAADVSEGKNDPIYNAHSYHTKVPHKAIMRYILHYTEPGDIVFDGFCGTGMTGVAAQMCGDKDVVMSLGYQVKPDGTILQEETDADGKKTWKSFSKLGERRAVLNDLSPSGAFIAYNYNTPVNVVEFQKEASHILEELDKEFGWMYETKHTSAQKGKINYIVWSELIGCSNCGYESTYWQLAVDPKTRYRKKKNEPIKCPACCSETVLSKWNRIKTKIYDEILGQTVSQVKQQPVLINYSYNGKKYEKDPDKEDFILLNKIEEFKITSPFPRARMPEGDEGRRNDDIGITHIHHFYSTRTLAALSFAWKKAALSNQARALKFWIQTGILGFSKLNRYLEASFSQVNRYLKGTLYVAPFITEVSPDYALKGKITKLSSLFSLKRNLLNVIQTKSTAEKPEQSNCIDYIFTDPPFGGNIMYSDLNFIWDGWLGVFENTIEEAIVSKAQSKGLPEYQALMSRCFCNYFQLLKSERWMTVEFHNSKNSVWVSIQEALQQAGFVVADVRILDKKQMTMQQMTSSNAVKQDLIISAYKPSGKLEQRFQNEAGTEDGVWDFIRNHLKLLPILVDKGEKAEAVIERQKYSLFDRMVAFHVQRGVQMPISSSDFYIGLTQRFAEREGMFFLEDQVAEYDRKRIGCNKFIQASLFVTDEASAIQWLRYILKEKPQSFQEIHPLFMQEISGWNKMETFLELSMLLEQNFLRYDGKGPVPEQIHSYLSSNWKELRNLPKDDPKLIAKARDRWYVPDPNKAGDLEKLRERALLKEFEEYKQTRKKLKVFRLEAVRAGFKKAWQERDYSTIISVAEKIPDKVLEEDPKLLMWYDQAITRTGGE
jgi:DNA modification methylase